MIAKSKLGIGSVVVASLGVGFVVAIGLVVGPLAGAKEHVITAGALFGVALGWAILWAASIRWTEQAQRWALLPAEYFGLAGAALLLFAPSSGVLDILGLIWAPVLLSLTAWMFGAARRSLRSRSRAWVLYPTLGVYALSALGAGYQSLREYQSAQSHIGPGAFVDVGDHKLHLLCIGSGAPTVVLESGLGETSEAWDRIATQLSQDTRVCVYDRAGRGASERTSIAPDGNATATDLHTLLTRAGVPGPYVLAGHSSGGQYVLIYAATYPNEVAGVVLLDAQPSEAFTGLPDYPAFYRLFRRASAALPLLARLGVARLIYHNQFGGLSPAARDRQRASYSSARHFSSMRNEFLALPATLAEGRLIQTLDDVPLAVVTAARDAQPGWLPLQDKMATLSTNAVHRVSAQATHSSLIEGPSDSAAAVQAIRDVLQSARLLR